MYEEATLFGVYTSLCTRRGHTLWGVHGKRRPHLWVRRAVWVRRAAFGLCRSRCFVLNAARLLALVWRF